MAQFKAHFVVPVLLMMLLAFEAKTGIAKDPSSATCNIKKYKLCYNSVHVCPEFCPDSCTVECASCKPICSAGSTLLSNGDDHSPQNGGDNHSPPNGGDHSPPDGGHDHSPPNEGDHSPPDGGHDHSPPNGDHHSPPISPTPATPTTPEPFTPPPSTPTPPTPTPTPSTPSPTPPTPTPSTPTPTPPTATPTPTPPTTPTPSTPSPTPPTPIPSTPSPKPPTPTPPTTTPTPPTPSWPTPTTPPSPTTPMPSTPTMPSPSPPTPSPTPPTTPKAPYPPSSPTPPDTEAEAGTARCRNHNYPQCYNMEHVCPKSCPGGCEVDCVTCKPVCRCDRPGAVCQDPRFIGGDGITFYFHGKKDKDFCLVSDSNLHINAHFIGRRNHNMKRDFTWVQSIAIFFDNHQLFIGALKTSTWDDSIDRLDLSFDGEPLTLPETDGSKWQSTNVSIARVGETNSVSVEVQGKFKITANVVPITEQDSRVHNYGIAKENCFAHLDLGFKFYSLSDEVNGILGQTYRADYVTRVNMGASMPVMGGDRDFQTSGLFAADCAVSRFTGGFDVEESASVLNLPSLRCASGIDGKGVVCKR